MATTTETKQRSLKKCVCKNCGVEFMWKNPRGFCSTDCCGEFYSPPPSLEEIERKGREIRVARGLGEWTESLD